MDAKLCSLTPREGYKLRGFVKRMVRKIFGPERQMVAGD
jgi:hypothetical protein